MALVSRPLEVFSKGGGILSAPNPPNLSTIKRVVIVKLSSIGDVVQALPVSAALGRSFPHLHVSWVVEEAAAPMLEGNPYLKDILILPRELRQRLGSASAMSAISSLRKWLKPYKFEVAIDLQGLTKSALVAWSTGAAVRVGYDWLRELAPLLVQRVPRDESSVHVVDQFLDVARYLGARVEHVEFPIHVPAEVVASARLKLADVGVDVKEPFIAVNPTSGKGGNKGWGAAHFAESISALVAAGMGPIVLVGGPSDSETADEIVARCPTRIPNLVGQTTLKELTAVLRYASLHLCGDTASGHIASAVGTPVVSLFGRSNPARLAPYGQVATALHHREACHAKCRRFHESSPVNCSQKCLTPPPICLTTITCAEVVDSVRTLWHSRT